jgi:Uncharacterized conserved protein
MITVTRTFTLEEARRTIPLVKQIVLDILSTGHELNYYVEKTNGNTDVSKRIEELLYKFQGYIQELEDLGCYYKDWNFKDGLVDFPATIEGREVFLCWKCGENDIKYYHDVDAGYTGRKEIPEELFTNN